MKKSNKLFAELPQLKKHVSRKKFWIIGAGVLAVVVVVVGIWWFMASRSGVAQTNTQKKTTQVQTEKTIAAAATVAYSDASQAAHTGDYSGGQATLDKVADQTTDSVAKAVIYTQKSSIAYNSGKYDDAYSFAKKAEEINPTVSTASLMARAAEKQDNKKEAIAQYKVAVSRITGNTELDELDRQELNNNITKLEN